MNLQELVEHEMEQREQLKKQVMQLVETRCSIGKGFVKRGKLSQYIYEQLGFHGRPGDHFFRFMNSLMANNGFRVSFTRGQRVYFGLTWKEDEQCQDQPKILPETPSTS